ncbi:amino acid ABC transporter permease [Mesosutterella sp. AGMB02718]|uniref:Amino acid ABC transporter permease n=1 Tax=Mesosutterella faecium TaxID=2925194 RepID=A0ABT7INW1_9BURK|nr:amino acid ABC transporter permease [Mesosutterella sp. AGMB02718]MDL2059640.1 amino acid ABC transporter permease [Mesosutterella sp. AGMB02718]
MGLDMDWSTLLAMSDLADEPWWEYMLGGAGITIALTLSAGALALAIGTLIGVIRAVPNRFLNWFGETWVEVFRNVPLLVQLFLWYFVLPEFVPPLKSWMISTDPVYGEFFCAFMCLGIFTSVRVAENVKSGIRSLPRGQLSAAYALGMTTAQAYRYVLLPVAFRITLPPLNSEAMNLMKNTATSLTIGLADLTLRSHEMGEMTFQFFVAFCFATIVYIVISMTINRSMAALERAVAIPGYIHR